MKKKKKSEWLGEEIPRGNLKEEKKGLKRVVQQTQQERKSKGGLKKKKGATK